jgi:O-antigen ligase
MIAHGESVSGSADIRAPSLLIRERWFLGLRKLAWEVFIYSYMLGLLGVFAFGSREGVGFGSISRFVFPVLYVLSLVFLLRHSRLLSVRNVSMVFFLFAGLIVSSMMCYSRVASLINVLALLFNFIFALVLAARMTTEEFLRYLLQTLTFVVVLSIAVGLVSLDLVTYVDPGGRSSILGTPNIEGLFPHKIHAAVFMSIGFWLTWSLYRAESSTFHLVLAGVFLLAVLVSGSSLGLVLILSGAILYPALISFGRRFGTVGLVWLALSIVAVIATVKIYSIDAWVLGLLGRDTSLTGRVDIWMFGVDYFLRHPLFGGGVGVFFEPYVSAPAYELWRNSKWYFAPSFHNGYIQLFAEAGIVGALGVFYLFVGAVKYACRGSVDKRVGFVLFVLLIANMGSSLFLNPNSLLFVFASFLFAKEKILNSDLAR